MKIFTKAQVNSILSDVINQVNQGLLANLAPPDYIYKTILYQGEKPRDQFEFHFGPPGFRQIWRGEIIERVENDEEFYFIDQSHTLPFPLKNWKHRHHFAKDGDKTWITDEIEFSAGIFTILLYPLAYGIFWQRQKQYKKIFSRNS